MNKAGRQQALDTGRFRETLKGSITGQDVITGEKYDVSSALALSPKSVLVLELD